MPAYHIGKSGEPTRCQASTRNCPLGGEHFSSLVEARNYIEAKEVLKNNGSFTKSFTKARRKKMFESHPSMTYAANIDDAFIAEDGSEWVVVSKIYGRRNGRDDYLPTISLAKVPTGEIETINPYEAGTKELKDFRYPKPEPVILDAPPVHLGDKWSELPKGKSAFHDVVLQRVEVTTGLDGEKDNRFLIVEKPKEGYFSKKDQIEISEAMWNHAGRDTATWSMFTEKEKLKYYAWNTQAFKDLVVKNTGKTVDLFGFNKKGELYSAVSTPLRPKDVAVYSI